MRLATISRTLLMLALPPVLVTCAFAQANVNPNTVRDQLMKAGPGQSQPQSAPQKPAANTPAPATKAAATKAPAAKAAATTAPSTKAPAASKSPANPAPGKSAKVPAEKPAEEVKVSAVKRDPFETLLNKAKAGNAPPENLPPGKAGLIVGSIRINGIVRGTGGMIAIVSNGQQRVYFLREGDKLYDGAVDKITLDAISFREFGKDAFGKPLERQVTKRLYPSPGEQQ
jgi:hypothetical protein